MNIRTILDKAGALLQGEPLRAIGYGAGLAIYILGKASGKITDVPLDQAIPQGASVVGALVTLVEFARRMVYSAPTVAAIVNELNADKPVEAAPDAPADEVLGTGEPVAEAETLPDGDARVEALDDPAVVPVDVDGGDANG